MTPKPRLFVSGFPQYLDYKRLSLSVLRLHLQERTDEDEYCGLQKYSSRSLSLLLLLLLRLFFFSFLLIDIHIYRFSYECTNRSRQWMPYLIFVTVDITKVTAVTVSVFEVRFLSYYLQKNWLGREMDVKDE